MIKSTASRKLLSQCACCEIPPRFEAASVSRRDFVAGSAAALGLAASVGKTQAQPVVRRRVDVHHHIVPPVQVEALNKHRGNPVKWSASISLENMDKAGVTTAVTSIQNPGVWFGQVDEESRKLARECNEYAKKLEGDHPGRFRSFAVIPLPDTEGSLREIEYALDVLKAEGIALWTVYSGKYLGDPAFLPVFEELNRRKAVVYTHPTVPDCCNELIKGVGVAGLEYSHDTTRTIASLVLGDGKTALRCPDVKFIWSHSGGTLPFLTSRFEGMAKRRKDDFPKGVGAEFKKFYYEVAQGTTPGQLDALFHMVPASQVMFGSDSPYHKATEAVEGLAAYRFTEADRRAIDYGNAQRIMPRLAAI
jgi:predicted TIM-barrel fold metal-dependent hydrolase